MSATPNHDSTTHPPRLYLAFEVGWNQWKLGFATGLDAKPWRKTIEARDGRAGRGAFQRARSVRAALHFAAINGGGDTPGVRHCGSARCSRVTQGPICTHGVC